MDDRPFHVDQPTAAELHDMLYSCRAQVRKLEERLPCGHRKIDWDDSYGGCVACMTKAEADQHEECPADVVDLQDRVRELQEWQRRALPHLKCYNKIHGPSDWAGYCSVDDLISEARTDDA